MPKRLIDEYGVYNSEAVEIIKTIHKRIESIYDAAQKADLCFNDIHSIISNESILAAVMRNSYLIAKELDLKDDDGNSHDARI